MYVCANNAPNLALIFEAMESANISVGVCVHMHKFAQLYEKSQNSLLPIKATPTTGAYI